MFETEGFIKEETPGTITIEVGRIRRDGSTCKMLFICDKDTVWWTFLDKLAHVRGHIFPSNQKNVFFLKAEQV